MRKEALEQAVLLAKKMGYVFLGTADCNGVPHLSIVQPLDIDSRDRLRLIGWFCERTTANLENNPHICVVIWDHQADCGYQLIGETQDIKEVAILDGYSAAERSHPLPQVERKIFMRVDKILEFAKRPQIDIEV